MFKLHKGRQSKNIWKLEKIQAAKQLFKDDFSVIRAVEAFLKQISTGLEPKTMELFQLDLDGSNKNLSDFSRGKLKEFPNGGKFCNC